MNQEPEPIQLGTVVIGEFTASDKSVTKGKAQTITGRIFRPIVPSKIGPAAWFYSLNYGPMTVRRSYFSIAQGVVVPQ